ncbi:MAG: LuxR C-terminal-related transcriptional regulator, partial [Mycobacterium leprae]
MPRPRLVAVLEDTRAPLTLLAAGPGAGKTVLLCEWAQSRRRGTAWMSLTAADDEPRRFWARFLDAVRAVGVPAPDLASLWAPQVTAAPSAECPAVVLDDAHLLTRPDIVDGLDILVRRAGDRLRLVLAARSDPLVALAEHRAAGRLCELRAADLAMTAAEARLLLAEHGVAVSEGDLELLMARTEGWVAGVRLCALRLEGSENTGHVLTGLALDSGSIGEFLIEEVLDQQEPRVRRLLVETSFLPEVSGPLADAVCGTAGSDEHLARLARRGSFLMRVDAAGSGYRYHPLLQEVLRHLLDREPETRRRELFRRAALWHRERGCLLDALTWAERAGDRALVASLVARGGLAAAFVRRRSLAADLPPRRTPRDDAADEAVSALGDAESAIAQAALSGAAVPLHATTSVEPPATSVGDEVASEDPELLATLDLARLVEARRRADLPGVDAAAARLLAPGTVDDPVRKTPGLPAAALIAWARARLLVSGPAAAMDLLAEKSDPSDPILRLELWSLAAAVDAFELRRRHPDDAQARALEQLERDPALRRPAPLDVAIAWRAYARADHATAAAAARRAGEGAREDGDAAMTAAAALLHARVLTAVGDPYDARSLLHRFAADVARAGSRLVAAHAMALARIETLLRRPHAALSLLQPLNASPSWPEAAVESARAHLLLENDGQASRCVAEALATGSRYERVEALLVRAQLLATCGAVSEAAAVAAEAADVADGMAIQPFLDADDALRALLARRPGLVARLPVTALAPVAEPVLHRDHFAFDPADSLTDREQAVLRLLTTEMTTAEIAESLYLSLNTVKTHLASVYR